jgi:hypothetical protein
MENIFKAAFAGKSAMDKITTAIALTAMALGACVLFKWCIWALQWMYQNVT